MIQHFIHQYVGPQTRLRNSNQISCLVYDTACRVRLGERSGTPIMCSYDYMINFKECESLCTEWNDESGTNDVKPCAGFQTYATRMYPWAPGECQLIKGNQDPCPHDGTQIAGSFLAHYSHQICADPFLVESTSCYAVFDDYDTCDDANKAINDCPDAAP